MTITATCLFDIFSRLNYGKWNPIKIKKNSGFHFFLSYRVISPLHSRLKNSISSFTSSACLMPRIKLRRDDASMPIITQLSGRLSFWFKLLFYCEKKKTHKKKITEEKKKKNYFFLIYVNSINLSLNKFLMSRAEGGRRWRSKTQVFFFFFLKSQAINSL